MKKWIGMLLLAPSLALAQYSMEVIVSFGIPPGPFQSTQNSAFIWNAQPITGLFLITGFPDLPTCQAFDPLLDLTDITFNGFAVPPYITSTNCIAGNSWPAIGGGGGITIGPPPSSSADRKIETPPARLNR